MIKYRLDLQLFAQNDDKTEKATPKKREEARKKGQVLQSKELSSTLVVVLTFIGLRFFGKYIYEQIVVFTKRILTEYPKMEDLFTINVLYKLFYDVIVVLLKTVGPILAISTLTGLIAGYAQVGFLFTLETIGFKFNRINPASGLKRVFSMHSIVELLKSIIKVAVVGFIAYSYLSGQTNNILNMMSMDVMSTAVFIGTTIVNIAIRICIAMFILAILDYAYNWWEQEKNLRMSKQEIKEEFKQTEGNPEIKAKIKQKQRQISMRRMLHEIPKADVVITNPTHFAVAVKYDAQVSKAPVVTAKGQDFIALRIKEIARENNVEIVENRPLARTLYETVEIGNAIPADLYQAVAEVLAFVYNLKGKTGTE